MSAAIDLYEIGYEDLVSVIPPGAPIAPNSSVSLSQLGKCPGKKTERGWVGYAFTKEAVSPEQMERWGANVGLLGDRFPCLDIDSEWPTLTTAVMIAAEKTLGATAVRLSREPRRALVYRTEEPFARVALNVTHEGQTHTIEWLGKGRQYLVDGMHPTNVPYRWAREPEHGHLAGDLWDFVPEELPLVTRETAVGFLELLKSRLESKGLECAIIGDGRTSAEKSPPQEDLLAPSIDALIELVARIPNDFDERDEYVTMGHAIKAAAGKSEVTGLGIFDEWARRWAGDEKNPDGNNYETVASDWSRMHGPFRVGWTWLQELAGDVTDDFEDLPTEQEKFTITEVEPEVVDVVDTSAVDPALSDEQAVRFVLEDVGDMLRRVPASGDWHIWNGHVWELDQRDLIFDVAGCVLNARGDALIAQAEGMGKGERKAAMVEVRRLQSGALLDVVVKRIGQRSAVTLKPTDFDADPWLLNTPGAVLQLEADGVRVIDSNPGYLLSKATGVAPAKGKPERWLQFLHEATGGDTELQVYLQKLVGYALTGKVSEQVLVFIWGRSNTGKSVFLRTISGVFGTYAKNTSIDTFLRARGDRVRSEEAALVGARLVTASESNEGRAWDEEIVKGITAGDERTVRHLYGHPFSYEPTFQIIIAGNSEPTIRNLDDAMRRRLHVVPLDAVVPAEDRDPALPEKLKAEWPQILKWAIEGYVLWRREGLVPPESVLAKTTEYFSEEDLIAQWVEECCDLGPFEEARRDLYGSWEQWCNQGGYDAGTLNQFRKKLIRSSFTLPGRQVGVRRLQGNRGIRVKPAILEGVDGEL